MEFLLAVLIAAYAAKGVGADVAAAVAGKTPPSVLKWEARQKRRETPRAQRGYWGRIWDNAVESWADASTRRHNRRMALRQQWEARKGPEWIEKKLVKLEKAADRRRRFAERFGVLWGKPRDALKGALNNIRERRLEDEAWDRNAQYDAEGDPQVPAGLKGSDDLDDDMEGATVLPFRARQDDPAIQEAVESTTDFQRHQGEKTRPTDDEDAELVSSVVHTDVAPDAASEARPLHETNAAFDVMTCLWGAEEGNRCTALRLDGSAYCGDHKLMDDLRCKWSDLGGERCTEPVYGRSPFCFDHHTEDPDIQDAIEARWGRPLSPAVTADQPAHGGQDSNTDTDTDTQEVQLVPTPNMHVPSEIASLTDAIAYTQAMQDSLTAVDSQVDQWSADLRAFAEKARAANTEVETAIASLRGLGVEGHQIAALESAREQLAAIAAVFGGAAEQVGAASDSAQAGAAAFGQAHQAFLAQTGIQEQMQAAAASGNRAGKREFYEAG